jgi:hemerythrin
MAKHNFPALSTHRAQHEMFRNQIAAFLKDYESGKSGVPVSLLQFMQSWLKQHVMRTDKQYSDFLNARGVH